MKNFKKVPYQFLNEKKNGKHVLTLSGTIRKRGWSESESIDAELVRNALDDIEGDVTIYLNSPGGDAFEGVEICNYLKNHKSKITVEVTGQAASAATFILAGADIAVMDVGTTALIHEASTFAWGNKGEIKKILQRLEAIDESIMEIYTEKTGQTEEQLKQWMEEERTFTAEEAVKYGFADMVKKETKEAEDIKMMIGEAVAVAMANYKEPERKQPPHKSLLNKLRKEVK